ncbi:MAG: TetR/AcrR family transcriptional regulator [Parachlamydiales bacterium]|jgi:AcrR family transcriptional regulator
MARVVKKASERRADIINAARFLFLKKKYDQTSIQDVMEVLNIAKGTIYHYFKSKEEILEAVVKDIVEGNFIKMQACIKNTKGDALQKMQALVETGHIAKDNQFILDQLHETGNEALHLRLFAATLVTNAPLYAIVIKQGCEEGIFKTDNPLECAEFILSGYLFMTDKGIYPWSDEDVSRRMLAFPRLVEQTLNAPLGSFQFLVRTFAS